MRRTLPVVAVALAIATLVPSGSAGAAPPQQDRFPVDVVIPSPGVCASDLTATSWGRTASSRSWTGRAPNGRAPWRSAVRHVHSRRHRNGPDVHDLGPDVLRRERDDRPWRRTWASDIADGSFVIASGKFVRNAVATILEAKGNLRDLCQQMP